MSRKSNRAGILKKAHWRRQIAALFWIAAAVVLGSVAAAATSSSSSDQAAAAAVPNDPDQVLGNATCVRCHAAEQQVWSATPHARTFDELHRRPEAAQIAKRLGVTSIKHSGRCVACHYTQQRDPHASAAAAALATTLTSATPVASSEHPGGAVQSIAGVSCESCHGPARQWLEAHHDYGDATTTRLTESPAHRIERIARSVALGMRNPSNVYLVAQSCYRCHTTGDEELVNVGQHSAGSADFEFVSWSQGTLLHNFVGSDGKLNQPSSPHRLRYMFVAGVIADTEASLRAVATATVKDRYAIAVAKRAARAGARLRSVAEKMDDARFKQASDVFASIQIKLNNEAELEAAANKLAEIGYAIAATESDDKETALHQKLIALDRFIPDPKLWK